GAVGLHNVRPAVVVVIQKLHRNAAQPHRFVPDPGGKRHVVKGAVVVVVIETIQFEVQVRDVNILPAVTVHIRGVEAHAGFVAPVFTRGYPRNEGDILERSIMLVEEKKIRPGVVGNGDVRPAIVVKVRQHHAQALGFGFSHAGSIADIGEGSVVVVVIQLGFLPPVIAGMAIGTIAGPVFAAPQVVLRAPFDVVGDNQIQPAVFIVV